MSKSVIILIRVIACISILFTFIPLLTAEEWYVRIFDFPRMQIFIFALLSLLIFYFFDFRKRKRGWVLLIALLLTLAYQAYNIYPYTQMAPKQVAYSEEKEGERHNTISLLVSNVLMDNTSYQKLTDLIDAYDADMVLTLETDSIWEKNLASIETAYPYQVRIPQSNTYGMHLYSRLPLKDTKIMYWLDIEVPSLKTMVQLPGGKWVEFHGVHPKPPVPGETNDSRQRDAEILIIGNRISKSANPVLVAGDFNDVAWSHTTLLFQKVSGLLDPRIGRGFYSTFHADYFLFRWPLDHVFLSAHFKLLEIKRLPDIDSDHFPIYLKLSYEPAERQEQQAPEQEEDTAEKATETIREGIEDAKKPEEARPEKE